MDIDQHLLFVGSSFLLSNFLYDKFRKSYSGLKYFFALIFPIFAAFSRFSSLYILRYSHKLPIGLLCMEIVLYRCQLAVELRNGVFIWILGHFLRATVYPALSVPFALFSSFVARSLVWVQHILIWTQFLLKIYLVLGWHGCIIRILR